MGIGLERIADLVVKLRTFSRLDEGERKTVSVRECVESVMTILGHRWKDRVAVELSLGEPDQLDCFPALLNQALLNLVSNALDAMQDRGALSITTGLDGDSYSMAVADRGPGIPDELRARVLEPFFTTKPVGQGTGLGLSITYSIVRKHGGTLELRSRDGGGTIAEIRLPLRPVPGR
jgi:two-component system NtrC family sensor kinase